MATQEISYVQGTDTGEREAASIAPIIAGEKVKASVMDRPFENLRSRTEVIRDELIDQKYLQDTDIKWVIGDGVDVTGLHTGGELPQILWDLVTKKFTVLPAAASLLFQPLKTPRQDTTETEIYTFGGSTVNIGHTTAMRNYAGANRLTVTWEAVTAASIAPDAARAQVLGAPDHELHIQVLDDGSTTVAEVSLALLSVVVTLTAAGFTYTTTGPGTDVVPIPVPADFVFSKVHEREMHRIVDSQFAAFFAASPSNVLNDGDTLAISYDYMVEPGTTGGRRQSCTTNANITLGFGQLFITTNNPELIPIGIPICKRIGDDLIFIDGTVCYGHMTDPTIPVVAGEHGYTVNRIYTAPTTVPIVMTSKWFGAVAAPTWGTTQAALDGIVGDLGSGVAAHGASFVGMSPYATTPTSLAYHDVGAGGESVFTTLTNLLSLASTKASLGAGAAFGAEEIITGRWRFDNHVRIGIDKVVLRSLTTNDGNYHLIYRNGGISESGTVTWETHSVYEQIVTGGATDGSYIIEVWGGTLSADGLTVTTPAAGGPGGVRVEMRGAGKGVSTIFEVLAEAHGVAGGTTLTIGVAADWDYLNVRAGVPGNYFNNVAGNALTSVQNWAIPQAINESFDFQTGAHVKIASYPATYVLEGFWAIGPHATLPMAWDNWTKNYMLISPGRALVAGIPVIKTTTTVLDDLDDAGRWMNGIPHLPTDNTVEDTFVRAAADHGGIPGWWYVWLRKDGEFFIGKCPPVLDYNTTGYAPGSYLHRPIIGEVHVGYAQSSYVLVDVIMLVGYTAAGGGSWWFDSAPRIGGNVRTLRTRHNPGTADYIRYEFDVKTSAEATTNISLYSNYSGSGEAEARCPGVPLGVTQLARIGYNYMLDGGGTQVVSVWGGDTGSVAGKPGCYPAFADTDPVHSRAVSVTLGGISSAGVFEVPVGYGATGGTANTIYRGIVSSAGTINVRHYLVGFVWDRSQVSNAYHD